MSPVGMVITRILGETVTINSVKTVKVAMNKDHPI
jgi:hypothetical protein